MAEGSGLGFAVDWLGSFCLVSYGCLAQGSRSGGCGVGVAAVGALDASDAGVDAD